MLSKESTSALSNTIDRTLDNIKNNNMKITKKEALDKIKELQDYVERLDKKEVKSWEDLEYITGWFIAGEIIQTVFIDKADIVDIKKYKDLFRYKNQARSALAMAQLSQLMAHESYNGSWFPDWSDGSNDKYTIHVWLNTIGIDVRYREPEFLAFKSEEIRDRFLENHRDLIEEYFLMFQKD